MIRHQVIQWLEDNLPQPRVAHILRVEQTAAQLAERHQLNVETAAQAGLLHDLAKYFPPQRLLAMARTEGVVITAVDEANPRLLHADVSAIVARDQFQVDQPEILAAVANHTLGQPGMSPLSCVVFLADSLEPGRRNSPELETIREIARQDLHQAVWMTCDRSLNQLLKTQKSIHPRMVLTRNWALALAKVQKSDNPSKQPISA